MKKLVIPFMLLSFATLGQSSRTITDVCDINNSRIIIYGTSNVTDYSCKLYDFSNNTSIKVGSTVVGNRIELTNAKVNLKTISFACDNKIMTNDFYEAIKGEVYKYITVQFHEFTLQKEVKESPIQSRLPSVISITLAGKKNTYNHTITTMEAMADQLTLRGTLNVAMTEFGVNPPTALFGAVKTEDQIQIEYSITFSFK